MSYGGCCGQISKLSLCSNNENPEERVIDHLVANEEAIEISAENDVCIERFSTNIEYILRGSNICQDSGGRIIFYLNMVKNEQM